MKTVSTAELAQSVARELSAPEPQTRAVLERAIEVMRKELQRGNSIDLPQFLSLQVKQGDPVVTPNKAGGSLGLPAGRLLQLDVDASLRHAIEGPNQFRILLVVPRQNSFTGVMACRLATARSEVIVVEGVEAAVQWLKTSHADLVVLDTGLKDASLVCAEVKKERRSSLTSVIAIKDEAPQTENHGARLELLPDEEIREPFELGQLVKLTEAELARSAEERNYFEHEMHFRLATTEELVEEANEVINYVLNQSGLNEDAAAAFAVAFREALDNGARHGNQYNSALNLDVEYLVDRERVTVAVTDQGPGFESAIYVQRGLSGSPVDAARERIQTGSHGGLGIMLMLKCVDKVEYNDVGNKVSLTRHIRKA